MAVNVEMWQPIVKEHLFKSNEFLATMTNADEYVVGGAIVHIPQSGGPSGAEKNRTILPATVERGIDTDVTYPLDKYTTNPRLIDNADQVELSYDKMSSIISEDTQNIMELAGDNILYDVSKLCPATSKLPTTGVAAAATIDGATGNRKIFTEADIRAARTLLNKQNVPKNDRFMVLDEDAIDQLMADEKLKYAFQQTVNIAEGTLPKLYGFQLISRSSVLAVDDSQVIKVPGAATAATDAGAAIFYQKQAVERALGTINVFEQAKAPTYYGDIISFLLRVGSRSCRADNKGYGMIYRAAA